MRTLMAMLQNHTGRRDVERQSQNGCKQQNSRKGREVECPAHVHADHQNGERNQDIRREKDIEKDRWDWNNHHQDECNQRDRQN